MKVCFYRQNDILWYRSKIVNLTHQGTFLNRKKTIKMIWEGFHYLNFLIFVSIADGNLFLVKNTMIE